MADQSFLYAVRDLSTTCYCQTPCKPGGSSSPSLGARAESTKPQGARVGQRSRTQSMPDIAPKLRGATNEMMWYLQRDSKWHPRESNGLNLLDRVDGPVRRVKSDNRGVNRRGSSWEPPEGKPRAVIGMSPSWEERAKGKRVSIEINQVVNRDSNSYWYCKQVVFIGIDMNTALPKIFATKTPVYRSSGLSIRAFPAHLLPPRPAPPFPLDLISKTRCENPCVYLSIITSKNQVSKLAMERNRVRRRLKAAWDRVINEGSEGWRLVSPGM